MEIIKMIYIAIKDILKKQNKTKYWFIKNMEADYQSMSNLLDNKTTSIHFETLEKICKLLDCEPNDIIKIKRQ